MAIGIGKWIAAAALALGHQGESPTVSGALPAGVAEPASQTLGYGVDNTHRMVLPVNISGRGPLRFVVDTGAERTSISRELASDLRLVQGTRAMVHSMSEVSRVQTYVIPALMFGARQVNGIHAPAFSRSNLGADGMLGVDALQSQRVLFDFAREEISIEPSRRRPRVRARPDEIVVTARSRFGRLLLVDASVEGQRVWAVLDTGSQVTVANSRLQRILQRRGRIGGLIPIRLTSVTGGIITADYGVVGRMRVGGVAITSMPMAFADVHPFRQLDLLDRPAILLGMDALKLFETVSVDFANRQVHLRLREAA
ncbi:retroviral-like aspartic protease family protein [Allosphingosinicella sp.]|jgi:predicted aspartyl protease|uniref:retroviral-like aspartic protease family protein n=1 Tax=Allosphingosinicella sp. TaxID=2823234 RepID=UPI002EDFF9EA